MKDYYIEQRAKAIAKLELAEEGLKIKNTELGAQLSEKARFIDAAEAGEIINKLDAYLEAFFDLKGTVAYYDKLIAQEEAKAAQASEPAETTGEGEGKK